MPPSVTHRPEHSFNGRKLTISKWDNEVAFDIEYLGSEAVAGYAITDGFEYEIHLDQKPVQNEFRFRFNKRGLNFYYQPPLTQQEIDDGAERPDNVIGSYAVYHESKQGHRIGDKNYETGKVCHIYRPKAVDANGVEQWGELDITGAVLKVTLPQDFLDNAVYPVVVDPTFGWTSQGASKSATGADRLRGFQAAPADGDGDVTAIDAWVAQYLTNTPATKAYVFVGSSGTYVGKSTAWTVTSSFDGQKQWTFSVSPSVTNGTKYALEINSNGSYQIYYDSATVDANEDNAYTYDGTGSASLSGGTRRFSVFATYTAAGSSASSSPSTSPSTSASASPSTSPSASESSSPSSSPSASTSPSASVSSSPSTSPSSSASSSPSTSESSSPSSSASTSPSTSASSSPSASTSPSSSPSSSPSTSASTSPSSSASSSPSPSTPPDILYDAATGDVILQLAAGGSTYYNVTRGDVVIKI